MEIRKYKPTAPGRRGASVADLAEVTRSKPEKLLLCPLHKTGDRSNTDRITARHKGGGHKCQYRTIDFKGWGKDGVPAKIAYIEYGLNCTARIALLHYADDEEHYIVVSENLRQGDSIESGPNANVKSGNNLPLQSIPVGITVYCVELRPLGGAKIGRSAGTSIQLVAREDEYAQLRMPSGEIRNVDSRCHVPVSEIGNVEQSNINQGKAGHKRWKDVHSTTRNVVTNPADHPHNSDEGKTSGGHHPVSPWGKPEGYTRRPKKASDKLIVRRRKTSNKR